jgi:pterin-4a-carbinolamine dehydratase
MKHLRFIRQCSLVRQSTKYVAAKVSHRQFYHNFSTSTTERTFDPTARKPNQKCDPYGQQGKPLSHKEASSQLLTLDEGWLLIPRDDDVHNSTSQAITSTSGSQEHDREKELSCPPQGLLKRFTHSNYLDAARFISVISAVAHNNHHYPTVTIQRRLLQRQKAWEVNSVVSCQTQVLNGLSYHDFYIAMLIDVEVKRDEIARLLIRSSEEEI